MMAVDESNGSIVASAEMMLCPTDAPTIPLLISHYRLSIQERFSLFSLVLIDNSGKKLFLFD
jgi:hypothetical protein